MAKDGAAGGDTTIERPQPGLTPLESAQELLQWIETGNSYARARKKRFMRRSSVLRVIALAFSAASTIILGLQDLDFWTGLGFSFIAITTVASAIEPFFAWRFRWVLMEEAQYEFYRLGDEVRYYISANPEETLERAKIEAMYWEYQAIWERLSRQ